MHFISTATRGRTRVPGFGKWLPATALALVGAWSATAQGLPGTHPEAVSTFDTRGSTVVLAYREGFLFDGTSRQISYNANFTATTGNFSAQFGAHYLQLRVRPDDLMLHGAAASGTALFSVPLSRRHPNGVPVSALNFYIGAVPVAAVSGPENFLSVPLNLGVGYSYSPTPWLTLSPWFEAAPSLNLDTTISEFDFTTAVRGSLDEIAADPEDPNSGQLTQDDVNRVLQDSVDLRFSTHVALRAGLHALVHLGEHFDLNAYGNVTSFGTAFDGTLVAHAGLGLIFHWDSVVLEVLPAERRLRDESCEDIERRFMACPAYHRLVTPAALPTPEPQTEPQSPEPRSPEPRSPTPQSPEPPSPTPAAPQSPEPPPPAPPPPMPPPAVPADPEPPSSATFPGAPPAPPPPLPPPPPAAPQ